MSKKMILMGWLAVAAGVSLAQEEAVPEKTIALQEVVVTATKFPVEEKETSKPVQVIGREQLDHSLGKDLGQVLQEQAGIIVNGSYSNPGSTKGIYVRGATTDFTLILVDGVPLIDPSGSGGVFDVRLIPMAQIERIEILKGSQSTLYGSGAIAGVINIITKKEHSRKIDVNGNFSMGSLQTTQGALGVGGQLKKFDYQVGFQHLSSKGISDAAPRTEGLDFDRDQMKQNGFNVAIGTQLAEGLRIRPYFKIVQMEAGFDGGAFSDANNEFNAEVHNVGAAIEFKKEKVDARVLYDYSKTDRFFNYEFSDDGEYHGILANIDAFATYQLHQKWDLLAGFALQEQKMLDQTTTQNNPDFAIWSPYVNTIYRPFDGFMIELGYRLNNHTKFGNHSTYSFSPSYWINEKIKAFGSYTTGYKAPTLTQLYGQWGANENLEPQESRSWEIGVESYLWSDKVNTSVTYFQRDIKNLIVYLASYENRDAQEDYGIEITANIKLTEKWHLNMSYDFLDGAITESLGSGDTTYHNLIRRPKHSVKAGLTYHPMESLRLSLMVQSFSDRTDYFWNPDNGYAKETVNLGAYTLINAHVEYQILKKKLSVFADLKNVTNIDFVEVYGYQTLGFNAQVGIRFAF